MFHIKAPNIIPSLDNAIKIFLAGSIEMGKAENWQEKIANQLSDYDNVIILNPRRDDWNNTWVQDIRHTEFRTQVEWELSCLEQADIIVFNFIPDTISPISLLELGKFADSAKTVVLCPDGYFRKGNIDIFCKRYSISQVNSTDALIEYLESFIINRALANTMNPWKK